MHRNLVAALAAAALLVLVTGVVLAATTLTVPAPDGKFYACYDNNGNVRFVAKADSACLRGYKGPVSWDQTAPTVVLHRTIEERTTGLWPGQTATVEAPCPEGTLLTGGGFVGALSLYSIASGPSTSGNSWVVSAYNSNSANIELTLHAYAICAWVD